MRLNNHYNKLNINISKNNINYEIIFRAYDDGISFKYNVPTKRHSQIIILLMNILSLIYLQKILHGGFQVFLIEGMNSYMQNHQ